LALEILRPKPPNFRLKFTTKEKLKRSKGRRDLLEENDSTNMRSILCLLILSFASALYSPLGAQNINVRGTVYDTDNGETLIGATLYCPQFEKGALSNEYGFFSLTLPKSQDNILLRVSYVGFSDQNILLSGFKDTVLNIQLSSGIALQEVVVQADSERERLNSTQMSVANLSAREAKLLPALFGEVDILKTVQLKPGIQSGAEGSSGLIVRGGSPDQNLILLDEAVVYNPNHLFGFFSTFNADAVKDLKIYKGGFPAEYGGRLSSVIDVRLRDGNNQKLSASGGIGLITSRLTVEGPIVEGKSSFIVSGRRTYVDLITNGINRANANNADFNPIPGYNFYDLNAKVNYKFSDKDQLFVSGYFGRDVFSFNNEFFNFGFNWGNSTLTTRWNHVYGKNLFSNTTFVFSHYQYDISNQLPGFSFNFGSSVKDFSLKNSYFYTLGNGHVLKAGLEATQHNFSIGRLRAGNDDGSLSFTAGNLLRGFQWATYVSDEWEATSLLRISGGLRLSGFVNNATHFANLEPRLAAKYSLNPIVSLKGSYARMAQYVHLIANTGISLPTDIWYPTTENVRPQLSDQVALGMAALLGKNVFLEIEGYYKNLQNQLEFKDNANLFVNENLENEFAFGKGYATGMEITLEKKNGKVQGWIGYTLAWINRGRFEALDGSKIMEGRYFRPRYDRRHDLSVVGIYELNHRITITGSFVYGSGDLTWLPSGRAYYQGIIGENSRPVTAIYGDRNNIRMPSYHRMDLGMVLKFFPSWGESDLTFSIYNAYDRRNPYFLFLQPELQALEVNGEIIAELPVGVSARQVSLFPILPSVTWNFKF
jgi:hypothetical protein